MIFALGVREERKSELAIRAATTNATVVKNPKTFWARTIVECIVAIAPKEVGTLSCWIFLYHEIRIFKGYREEVVQREGEVLVLIFVDLVDLDFLIEHVSCP